MTLIVDAAPLIALGDRDHTLQGAIESLLKAEPGRLVIPAPVSAEVDYMLGRRVGRSARLDFLSDLAAQRFEVLCLEPWEYDAVLQYERQYADLDVGLADLSIVVLAGRIGTRRVLTFDERHFRALRPLDGGRFTLLPADQSA